jgi:hypothetical protein
MPFTLAGVPGLAFQQDFGNYGLPGQPAADTLDKVDAEFQRERAIAVRKWA